MFKTVKGKVVAGVVTVGLLSSVGAVFANSDAYANLKNWYGLKFETTKSNLEAAAKNRVEDKVPGLMAEYNGIKTKAGNDIDAEKNTQISTGKSDIKAAANKHIKDLNDSKKDILNGMSKQFNDLWKEAQGKIEAAGEAAKTKASDDLTGYTSKQGEAARAAIDEELAKTQKNSVNELKLAIIAAKAELTTQLAVRSGITTLQINIAIDAKIKDLRKQINQTAKDLVDAQIALIDQQAKDDVKAATDELDSVVDGI